MVKLVIQIPCLNEERTLPQVLEQLPKKIKGVDVIEVQIINDGSTDKTEDIAKKFGVTRIITHKKNLGLGISFKHGVEAALEAGADILVNTDADNQYPSRYIPQLIEPILQNKADIVIGNRKPWEVKHFSPLKRVLQYFGNGLVRKLIGSDVPDTVSGFRAYNYNSLLRLNVTTRFSYVLDTIVQAVHKNLIIVSIPITTNVATRKSRLFKNIFQHMQKSGMNVLRCYVIYQPFHTFLWLSIIFFVPALLLLGRYFLLYATGNGGGRTFSLTVMSICFFFAGLLLALGILGEQLGMTRKLIEEQLYFEKKHEYESSMHVNGKRS